MNQSKTKEGKFYSDLCGLFPIMSNKGNIHILVMHLYDCNTILKTPINNRSYKDMMCDLRELKTDLKSRGTNPGFHNMDNEAPSALKESMGAMDIKYYSFTPSKHRDNNPER